MSITRVLLVLAGLVLGTAAVATAAVWLAGAAFFLTSGASPLGRVELGTWWSYWQAYSGDTAVRSRLVIAAVYGGLLAFAPVIGVAALVAKLRPRRSLHGDARFATKAEVRKAGLL